MLSPKLTTETQCLPIAAITLSSNRPWILYYGIGATLRALNLDYPLLNDLELPLVIYIDVFEHHKIHGISEDNGKIIVYGDKSVAIINYQFEKSAHDNKLVLAHTLANLDDLVLSCAEIYEKLIVGYAHNFIDIYQRSSCGYERIKRCRGPMNCVLFSMNFIITPTSPKVSTSTWASVSICCGTVFGKILFWNLDESRPFQHSICSHEGVIFRISYSYDHTRLASVSDDRTVRIYNVSTFSQLFVGWGHISRLWDATFVGSSNDLIATASEDSTVKIWHVMHGCLSTLNGHNGDVWRVLCTPVEFSYESKDIFLFSSGNDGTIKCWNLSEHLITSPHDTSSTATCVSIPDLMVPDQSDSLPFFTGRDSNVFVPKWTKYENGSNFILATISESKVRVSDTTVVTSLSNVSGNSRRRNGVCSVHCFTTFVVLILVDGVVWMVDLDTIDPMNSGISSCSDNSKEAHRGWYFLLQIDKQLIGSDILFKPLFSTWTQCLKLNQQYFTSNDNVLDLICAHPDGSVSYASISAAFHCGIIRPCHSIVNVTVMQWRPHDQIRTVNLWFLQNELVKFSRAESFVALTAAAKGFCKLWYYNKPEVSPTLLLNFQTCTRHIATSCLFLSNSESTHDFETNSSISLLIGDCRGNITIFDVNVFFSTTEPRTGTGACSINYSYALQSLHNPDTVSCISACRGGFCSLGHDGFVNYYQAVDSPTMINGSVSLRKEFRLIAKSSCLPIRTPLQMWFETDFPGEDVSTSPLNHSILVGGYEGSSFIVYNVTTGYSLLSVEGGAWKRPHDCTRILNRNPSLSRTIFVSAYPQRNNTFIQVVDSNTLKAKPPSASTNHCSNPPRLEQIDSALLSGFQASQTSRYKILVDICGQLLPSNIDVVAVKSQQQQFVPDFSLTRQYMPVKGSGETLYCSAFISDCLMIVGGEEGCLRLYETNTSVSESRCWPSTKLLQEVHLPRNVPVKTISTASAVRYPKVGKSIVVGAGGRLLYSIWLYDSSYKSTNEFQYNTQYLALSVKDSISPSASQDHRILCSSCEFLIFYSKTLPEPVDELVAVNDLKSKPLKQVIEYSNHYLVVFGDSRGHLTVLLYSHSFFDEAADTFELQNNVDLEDKNEIPVLDKNFNGRVDKLIEKCVGYGSPILCCSMICCPPMDSSTAHTPTFLCFIGDTLGSVYVWSMSANVPPKSQSQTADSTSVTLEATCLHRYDAHNIGTNSLDVSVVRQIKQIEQIDGGGYNAFYVVCVSGGDDQSMTMCQLMMKSQHSTGVHLNDSQEMNSRDFTSHRPKITRFEGASGSAIKGIRICLINSNSSIDLENITLSSQIQTSFTLVCVGYDQRLCAYNATIDLVNPHPDSGSIFESKLLDLAIGTHTYGLAELSVSEIIPMWQSSQLQSPTDAVSADVDIKPASTVSLTLASSCVVHVADVASLSIVLCAYTDIVPTTTISSSVPLFHKNPIRILVAGQGFQTFRLS